MPFIKRHVTRRLKAAKQECDKELTTLTNSITTFFEEKLRESEGSREIVSENTSTDELDRPPSRRPRESILSSSPRVKQLNPESGNPSSDEDDYYAEAENTRQSRQGSS
jgi:serine/threonine-protein kinase RIM15